jgi:hypothetical protein
MKLIGTVTAVMIVLGLVTVVGVALRSLPEMKRYLRMESM